MNKNSIIVFAYEHHYYDNRVYRTVSSLKKIYDNIYFFSNETVNNKEDKVFCYTYKKNKPVNKISKILFFCKKDKYYFDLLKKIVKKNNVKKILFHDYIRTPFYQKKVFQFLKDNNVEIIFDFHEYFYDQINFKSIIIKKYLVNMIVKNTNKYIFLSEHMKNYYNELNNINIKKYLILPNVPNTEYDYTKIDKKENYFVFAGRVLRETTLNKIINILEEVNNKSNKKYKLYIIGVEKTDDIIKYKSNYVEILDFMDKKDLLLLISKSKANIVFHLEKNFNSKYSLPNKFFDCLSVGTPVIASDYNINMKEWLVENKHGISIDTENENYNIMANDIIKFLESDEYNDIYSNLLKEKNIYNWNFYIDKFIKFVKEENYE